MISWDQIKWMYFVLKDKSLLDYTNFFSLEEHEKRF